MEDLTTFDYMNCQGHHHFFWVLPQLFWLQWADEKFIETLPEWLVLSGRARFSKEVDFIVNKTTKDHLEFNRTTPTNYIL